VRGENQNHGFKILDTRGNLRRGNGSADAQRSEGRDLKGNGKQKEKTSMKCAERLTERVRGGKSLRKKVGPILV